MNNKEANKKAFIRMCFGATIGFVVFAAPCTFILWHNGWFHKVPMFTPPPGLVVLFVGFVGTVIGVLLSLFS